MRIEKVLAVAAWGSYWVEDVTALQRSAVAPSERYRLPGQSPGFRFLREPGEAAAVGLQLSDGSVHWGDCLGVVYGGKAGRAPVFRAADGVRILNDKVAPWLTGRSVDGFRAAASERPADLDAAIGFGVTQALLGAAAHGAGLTPCELLCREWGLPLPVAELPLQGCTADFREGAERLIARRLDALPHVFIDDIPGQMGGRGEKLVEYAAWLSRRISEAGSPDYRPTIHLDVHGAAGKLFASSITRLADWLGALEDAAAPFPLRIESVVVEPAFEEQLSVMGRLRAEVERRGLSVRLFIDEWANRREDILRVAAAGVCHGIHVKMPDVGGLDDSIDAVLGCRAKGLDTLLGGTCNETDVSARAGIQVALATGPTAFLARPGMGIDEAVTLTRNEMARTLAVIRARKERT